MDTEHARTDAYLAIINTIFGADCGVKAVKQDGWETGTGMGFYPLMDYFQWPSGMVTHTEDMRYFADNGWLNTFLTEYLPSAEAELVKNKGVGATSFDRRTHKALPAVTGPSPCLEKYYPSNNPGRYL